MDNQLFERNVQTLSAIAKLLQMKDLSGTLVQLHRYFTDVLENEDDELRAGEIIKYLIDLSEYILSWQEARTRLDRGFLHLCTKILEDRSPEQNNLELDQQEVQVFFAKALELEPDVAQEVMGQMKEKQDENQEFSD